MLGKARSESGLGLPHLVIQAAADDRMTGVLGVLDSGKWSFIHLHGTSAPRMWPCSYVMHPVDS